MSDHCPNCGAPEVDFYSPRTMYACGSTDYDQRPGTFKQSEACRNITDRIRALEEERDEYRNEVDKLQRAVRNIAKARDDYYDQVTRLKAKHRCLQRTLRALEEEDAYIRRRVKGVADLVRTIKGRVIDDTREEKVLRNIEHRLRTIVKEGDRE